MVIELCVVQFWSEIILVISNQTCAARSFDFEITRMISDQIALHSVQLPLFVLILGETIVRNNSVDQAVDGRDGMAKVCGFYFYVAKVCGLMNKRKKKLNNVHKK